MRKLLRFTLFVVLSSGICVSQSLSDSLSQGTQTQNSAADCSDPSMAASAQCSAQRANSAQGRDNSSLPVRTPVLTNPSGSSSDQYTPSKPPLNPSQLPRTEIVVRPETEFEQM